MKRLAGDGDRQEEADFGRIAEVLSKYHPRKRLKGVGEGRGCGTNSKVPRVSEKCKWSKKLYGLGRGGRRQPAGLFAFLGFPFCFIT